MPLWPKCLTPAEPEVLLSRWRAFETSDGLMHLVGFDSLGLGRVSWAVGVFNHCDMRAFTSDGNTYQLIGTSGTFWDVENVWETWFQLHCVGAVTDVTEWLMTEPGDADARPY